MSPLDTSIVEAGSITRGDLFPGVSIWVIEQLLWVKLI